MTAKLSLWKGKIEDKIQFIKILMDYGEYVGLRQAKEMMDALNRGETVVYPIKDKKIRELRNALSKYDVNIQ